VGRKKSDMARAIFTRSIFSGRDAIPTLAKN
jgi:hypothetical protein